MKKLIISLFIIIFVTNSTYGEEQDYNADNLFHIGQMNSYDENFSLYFKTREKSILARGENFNYVTDFPQDLYIYNYKTKTSTPLISYEWFPSQAKFFLEEAFRVIKNGGSVLSFCSYHTLYFSLRTLLYVICTVFG